ncbi:hypothetical protein ECE50_023595 [Chitinophaga sp. Mgbs1]|uniref:Carboxypeptidase-like regulatory domain-containing protein n=1 Tax=Chitinophaga solisilvae TaxID=1233460 RepID=A0A9Q5DCG3_9BACT|nr:hypothetical protein [Chitinophaga solisilvae]
MIRIIIILAVLLCILQRGQAQSLLQGHVSQGDSIPLTGVTVLNKRMQHAAITDDKGNYQLKAQRGDTLLLKALGYMPLLYIVTKEKDNIRHRLQPQPIELQTVRIIRYGYLKDSQRLRDEFRNEFNFRRPRWNEVVPSVGPLIAVNINQLYRAVSFAKNRKKDRFKKILLEKEKQNTIDRLFNPEVITQLTGMEGDSLADFMLRHQPSYEFITNASDYDLYQYIREQYLKYSSGK